MRIRQLFQFLSLFFTLAIIGQLSLANNCYAEAFAYIPNSGDNTLSIIKVLDNSIVDNTIKLGTSPFGVAAGEDYIYVTNSGDGTASAISVSYNTVVQTLDVGASPKGIAVTSDGAYIYVANYTEGTVSAIDISSNTKTAIDIGEGPLGVALSPLQDYVYVTNSEDDSLSIISADSDTVFGTLKNNYYIKYLNSSSDIAFDKPYGVAVSADGYYIYVVNNGNNTLSILSASLIYSEGSSFSWSDYDATSSSSGPYYLYEPVTVGNDPRGVAVSPDEAYIYVTNYADDTVSVVNFSSLSVVKTISVGDGPYGISVSPTGDFVYVVNQLSGTVSVIDTDDNTVIDTVVIGNSPVGLGTFIGGVPPRAPSSLKATLHKTNTISLEWSDNSNDELGFKIMRKRYIGGTYALIATLDKGVTEYTDTGLKYDSNYYYYVYAYNYAGNSDSSSVVYATTGNDSSGCFIATAAYGSLMEPHVQILRNFRDRFLSTNTPGKNFLNLYYKYSPPIADYIAQHDILRFIIRWSLLPVVGMSWLVLFIGPTSATLLLASLMFLTIFSIGFIRRRNCEKR